MVGERTTSIAASNTHEPHNILLKLLPFISKTHHHHHHHLLLLRYFGTTTMPPLLTNIHHYHYLLPSSTSHHRHHHRHRHCHQPLITFSSVNRHHFTLSSSKRILLSPPIKSASSNEVSIHNNSESASNASNEFLDRIRKWVSFLPSIFPGGTWWNFSDDVEVSMFNQPVTVWYALGKMWNLVAKDRWVIFAAFSALIIAAVRSITIFSWICLVPILWFLMIRLKLCAFVVWVCVFVCLGFGDFYTTFFDSIDILGARW